ncbi:nuclease [Sporomusa sphaeroides]|uniref:Ada metal-binding domain-containing protein n=1 Tax=Sporomusa sphaeroides TaxID=47679 RepID=UPI003DA1C287
MATAYIGASTTGKFHYTDCRWANKIRADHRVYFSSREEAVNAGYVACKVCKP